MLIAVAVLTSVLSATPTHPPAAGAMLARQSSIQEAIVRIGTSPASAAQLTPPLRRPVSAATSKYAASRRLGAIATGIMLGAMIVAPFASNAGGDGDSPGMARALTLAAIGAAAGGVLGGVLSW